METQVINGSWIIAGSMKADKDSVESKAFRLKVMFKNVPTESVIMKALEPTKIQWVNGRGRKDYDKIKENELIEIDFKSPAKAPQLAPQDAAAMELNALETPEEQQAYIDDLIAKAEAHRLATK